MVILNPLSLNTLSSGEKKLLLTLFTHANSSQEVFAAGIIYLIGKEQIQLTHTVYKRYGEKNRNKIRYDIIHEEESTAFGYGGFSKIYRVLGTLAIKGNTLTLSTHKSRLSKAEKHEASKANDAIIELLNEVTLANLAGDAHMKIPAIDVDIHSQQLKSYRTLREIKSLNLFQLTNDERENHKKVSMEERIHLTSSALLALKKMHRLGVIHRDIKPENMFFDPQTNKTQFIDFGLAKLKIDDDKTLCGTPSYIAPELYKREIADEKSDLYSLGVTLSLMWGSDEPQLLPNGNLDFSTVLRRLPEDCTELDRTLFKNWLSQVTAQDRSVRLTVDEAINAFNDFEKHYKETHKAPKASFNLLSLFKRKNAETKQAPMPLAKASI